MSAGEAAIRKSANRRESYLAGMRTTIADFRRQSETWHREFDQLLDEVAGSAPGCVSSDGRGAADHEQLEQLAAEQARLTQLQQSVAEELSVLRQLLEQPRTPAPAAPPVEIEVLRQELAELRQATCAELAAVRQQLDKPASEGNASSQQALLAAFDARLAEMKQSLSREWSAALSAGDRPEGGPDLEAFAQLLDRHGEAARAVHLRQIDERLQQVRQELSTELARLPQSLKDGSPDPLDPSWMSEQLAGLSDQLRQAVTEGLRPVLERVAEPREPLAMPSFEPLEARLEDLREALSADFATVRQALERSAEPAPAPELIHSLNELKRNTAEGLRALAELAGREPWPPAPTEPGPLAEQITAWQDEIRREFATLQEAVSRDLSGLREVVESRAPAGDSSASVELAAQLSRWQQATDEKLLSVQQLLVERDDRTAGISLAPVEETLTQLRDTLSRELHELRQSIQETGSRAPTADQDAVGDRFLAWERSIDERLQMLCGLAERSAAAAEGAAGAELAARLTALEATLRGELATISRMLGDDDASREPLAALDQKILQLREANAREFAAVRQLLTALPNPAGDGADLAASLGALETRFTQLLQYTAKEFSAVKQLVERRADAEQLVGLQERLGKVEQSASSQLATLRKLLENMRVSEQDLATRVAQLAELDDQLIRFQQATAKDVGLVRQLVERQAHEEPFAQLAHLEQMLSHLDQSSAAQLTAVRSLVEQKRGSEQSLTAQLAQVANLDRQLSELQQSTTHELAAVRQLVERQGVSGHLAALDQRFTRLQESSATELNTVRQLVEQQTALLEAFVQAAERMSVPSRTSRPNPVVDAVQSQFEQLQKKSPGNR